MTDSTANAAEYRPQAGVDYPADVAEFRAWFPDDAACMNYLDWLRFPDGFRCPHCGADSAGQDTVGRYRCHGCRRRVSVISGTIFQGTKVPLSVWFETVWLVSVNKNGVSAAHLHRVLPIHSYPTVWSMLAKLRSVMSSAGREKLAGRVEIDETFFGGARHGVRGRGALGKTLVVGAIEITDAGWGRARLAVVADATTASLKAFINANIAAGSTVVTDGLASYPGALADYIHERVNVKGSGRPAHESLPAVHRLFAQVKRTIDGTYQGSGTPAHLGEYLDEFVFRFNRRHSTSRGLVFFRLLQRAITAEPIRNQDLVRNPGRQKARPPTMVPTVRRQPGSLDQSPVEHPWRQGSAEL